MDPRLAPLAEIFDLNSRLFHNCLDGLTAAQADARLTPTTNSAAFVAAHLADTRFALAAWLGVPLENPLAASLENARGIEDVRDLPALDAIRAAWDLASVAITERMTTLSAVELDGPNPQRFPAGEPTLLGTLTFLAQHDSYHIGQLALLRKAAGLPAMKYGRRPAGSAV
jgi:uncharacterized damage-inducible protein DinB